MAQTVPAGFVPDGFEPDAASKDPTYAGGFFDGNKALPTASAKGAFTLGQTAAEEVATNPAVPKVAAGIGRAGGAIGSVVGGALAGEPIAGVVGAAKGAWLGGKTGWFTGKLAQQIAAPVATLLEKAEPFVKLLGPISGAQGVGDLAQMADPGRKDIGFLGLAKSSHDDQHPAILNAALNALMTRGLSEVQALKALLMAGGK